MFREEIDIPDTMNASIVYANGVQVSYSLNSYMPIEGHHLAFNGKKGRIEIEYYGDDDLQRLLELIGVKSAE